MSENEVNLTHNRRVWAHNLSVIWADESGWCAQSAVLFVRTRVGTVVVRARCVRL